MFARWLKRFCQVYFRSEIHGWENIPAGPCLFVGNHNGGWMTNPEVLIWLSSYHTSEQGQVPLKALAHPLALKIPVVSSVVRSWDGIPADFDSALKALKQGHRVLVYPGGSWESFRPSRDRHRVDFKGRSGFARLAQEANVPIIPIVAVGAHNGWWVLARGARLAQWIGLKKYFSIDVFPVAVALPFGIALGPLMPPIPFPTKVRLNILPPRSPIGDYRGLSLEIVRQMQNSINSTRVLSAITSV